MNATVERTEAEQAKLAGLWSNCRDSFVHALDHFSALRNEKNDFHNKKWIVLSVHHAAEVFGNFLLASFDPAHPAEERFGKPYYPALRSILKSLEQHQVWRHLTSGERHLFSAFLPSLCDDRDALMHRVAPTDLNVSVSAIALIGLLHVVRRRVGTDGEELLGGWSPVEDVVDAMHWRDFSKYNALVEQLVLDFHPLTSLDHCPYCGALARIYESDCEACFSEEARRYSAE